MALGDLEVKGNTNLVGTLAVGGAIDLNGGAADTTLITNLNADKMDSADLDTDGTLAANSDVRVPSQKAVKTYADTGLALKANDNAVVKLTGAQTVDGVKTFSSDPVATVPSIRDQGTGAGILKCKVIEIGDWNMDTTGSVSINHTLTLAKIRTVEAMIRNDNANAQYPTGACSSAGAPLLWISGATATQITIYRLEGGTFDSNSYDSTSFNRGWIVIWYEI